MRTLRKMRTVPLLLPLLLTVMLVVPAAAMAAQAPVALGTTSRLAVLAASTLTNTGPTPLQGDPNAVFVFKTASTLVTASNSNVNLLNGARYCRVFWQVGSSATLGVNSHFVGHIFAFTSITANKGATVQGQLLARNGAVTLDTNTITNGLCPTIATTTTTTSSSSTTSTVPVSSTTTTTTTTSSTTTTTSTPTTAPSTTTTSSTTTTTSTPTTTTSSSSTTSTTTLHRHE